MKLLRILSVAAISLFAFAGCETDQDLLLMCGSGWNKIAVIDKQTKDVVWEHPVEKGWECNSLAYLGEGKILFSYKKGAQVIDKDHKQIWNIAAPEGAEMQTARLMPDGNCLLAWCGHPLTILEVSPATGEVLSKTEYETGVEKPHSQMRQVDKDVDGNYIVPLIHKQQIHIVAKDGSLVRIIEVGGKPFTTELLENGNYMVACGDTHCLKEMNLTTGEVFKTIGEKDIEGTSLFYVAGLELLKNGNMYICNWQGHSKEAKGPQIFEVNDKQEMVWNIDDNANFGKISDVSVVDEF